MSALSGELGDPCLIPMAPRPVEEVGEVEGGTCCCKRDTLEGFTKVWCEVDSDSGSIYELWGSCCDSGMYELRLVPEKGIREDCIYAAVRESYEPDATAKSCKSAVL